MAFFSIIFQFFGIQTFSPRKIRGKKPVNNSPGKFQEPFDFIGGFELFAGCSRAISSEQGVHINSLSVGEFAV
jgi:hypothetical protein